MVPKIGSFDLLLPDVRNMNSLARYKPSNNSTLGSEDFITAAERELSAFFRAVTELFGSELAEFSAEDWL